MTPHSPVVRYGNEHGGSRSGLWGLGKHAALLAALLSSAISAAQTGPCRVAGTVLNAVTGEPVSGATVALLTLQGAAFASTQTATDGRFSLDHLPAGKYQLTASHRGYSTAFYNQHDNFSSAVVTGQGQDTGSLVFRLAPESVLSGTVTGDGGDPEQQATVILFKKPHNHDPGAKIDVAGSATTDDTGYYEFPNLTAGEYLLAVRARPWYAISQFSTNLQRQPETEQQAALDVAYPATFFDSTTEEASATPIVLTSGSRQQANINLHAVPAVHIQVQAPRRPDGSVAQPDLRQTLFGLDVPGDDFMSRSRDGIVEFGGIAPGQYELSQGDPPRVVDLNATASQQIDPAAGTPAFVVSGTLQAAPGTVLRGPYLFTLQPAQQDAVLQPRPVLATANTFAFSVVPAGTWKLESPGGLDIVSIASEGHTRRGNLFTVQDHALSIVVTVSANRTVRIEGEARKNIKGFAGAMVLLVPKNLADIASLARRDQSDSDGTFALPSVEPGNYTVVAIEDGWDLDWGNPEVIARYLPAGQTVTVKDSSASQPATGRDAGPDTGTDASPGTDAVRQMTLPQPVVVQPRR